MIGHSVDALADALAEAHELADEIDQTLTNAGAVDPTRARDLVDVLTRAHDLAFALDRAGPVATGFGDTLTVDLGDNLVVDLTCARKDALALASVLRIDRIADLKAARDLARALFGTLTDACEDVRGRTAVLTVAVPTTPGSADAGPQRPQPGWMSRYLVKRAVWCLPRAHRARYREEFGTELTEITEIGGRMKQWCYAARLVGHSVSLRRALRAAVARREQS